jgi:hypothetical protein
MRAAPGSILSRRLVPVDVVAGRRGKSGLMDNTTRSNAIELWQGNNAAAAAASFSDFYFRRRLSVVCSVAWMDACESLCRLQVTEMRHPLRMRRLLAAAFGMAAFLYDLTTQTERNLGR